EVRRHEVDVIGKILPGAGDALHQCLAAELAFGADFTSHAGDFGSEGGKLLDQGVDGVFEHENFSLDVNRDLLGEVAICNGGGHSLHVALPVGEVRRHEVHVIGEILPCAAHATHNRLPAKFAFGTDFASHAGDFRSKC